MDRLETLEIFVAVADRGSFAEAARALNRSPAGVTRAVAALEQQLRARLLNRTTRSVALTEAGQRTLEAARRLLAASEELEALSAGEALTPRGTVGLTAPMMFGRLHVLPLVHGFLARFAEVDVRLMLLDRVVSLVDEGLDLGVRIGQLPDSSLRSLRVGQVGRGTYASPAYLAAHGTPAAPADLGNHNVVACLPITPLLDRWSFAGPGGPLHVAVKPRLALNAPDAAVASALADVGITCVMSYQVQDDLAAGRLVPVLPTFWPPAVPIHLLQPAGRQAVPKVRLLVEHLATGLRARFAQG